MVFVLLRPSHSGHCHGGSIATLCDLMCSFTAAIRGGMTRSLQVTYRTPTPLLSVLVCKGKKLESQVNEGFPTARVLVEFFNLRGNLQFSSEAVFVRPKVGMNKKINSAL